MEIVQGISFFVEPHIFYHLRKNYTTRINIHPPSGWFFTCGHSPLIFAMRKRIYTNCQLRGDCYLPPVNGPGSLIVVCDPGTPLLQVFSLPSIRIVALISSLSLLVFHNKKLFFDISAQIQYGTCNSTSYVINYLRHLCSS